MNKRCNSFGMAMLGALLATFAGHSSTLAQSGSTGGAIGDNDRSLSGDRPAVQPPQVSLTGRWSWAGDCSTGHYVGEFDLTETSPGHFSGSFAGTSPDDMGNIVNGVVDGTGISFTRTSPPGQHWSGQMTAGRIEGSISGSATCRWSARRK